jgi:mono/diheme cytochrome c family protein
MRTRLGLAGLLTLAVPLLSACPGDAERTPPPTPDQPVATQPATGAPGAPVTTAALPPGITAEMVQQGRDIFHGQGICFTCHGQNGVGGPLGPAMNDGEWIWLTGGADFEQLLGIIRTGVSQPREYPAPMPPMGGANLNEDQLRAVGAYVWSLNPQS